MMALRQNRRVDTWMLLSVAPTASGPSDIKQLQDEKALKRAENTLSLKPFVRKATRSGYVPIGWMQ